MNFRLNYDTLNYINDFICKKNFKLEKDIIESLKIKDRFNHSSCKIVKYMDSIACSIHDDIDYFNCINILSNTNKRTTAIHFPNKNSCLMASRYFSNFGDFSHYCCDGKGAMFLNEYNLLKFGRKNSNYSL